MLVLCDPFSLSVQPSRDINPTSSKIENQQSKGHPTLTTHASNQGVVFKKTLGTYYVNVDGETVVCSISTKLRRELIYPIADPAGFRHRVMDVEDIKMVDPVAVGDQVVFAEAVSGDSAARSGMITEVLPRRNKLTRQAPGKKPLEQVVVANVDQVVAVFAAAQPKPKWNMLDRYLASAEACQIPAVICLNKVDLVEGKRPMLEIVQEAEGYRAMGYRVILTSAHTSVGIEEFRSVIGGRTSVFVGMSGVGKTSLLNSLQPGLGLRVHTINTDLDKGRHTTTHLEMFALDSGGGIIDTPGMKVFGLWNIAPEDIALLYPDLRPYVGTCKFGLDCAHEHEPGCAIRSAVESGKISPRRYESYLHLREHPLAEDK
jgi:ribosome biogenesis GTPase